MKKVFLGAALAVLMAVPAFAAELSSEKQITGYAIGLNMSTQLKALNGMIDLDAFAQGVKDGMADKKPAITEEQMRTAFENLQKKMMEKMAEAAKENKEYLETNKAKSGVKVTPSGLQYEVVTEGTGKTPTDTDMVEVHYTGTLVDGTEFDSSHKRGQPATFGVKQVIPGWTEALKLMKEGGKMRVVLPAEIAYGKRGTPGIPPDSTLIFDMELLKVMPSQEASKLPAIK